VQQPKQQLSLRGHLEAQRTKGCGEFGRAAHESNLICISCELPNAARYFLAKFVGRGTDALSGPLT
jgi:hypothetical protein